MAALTPKERRALATRAAKARWDGIAPKERQQIARKAVQARWAKARAEKA